ncbi:sugar phosphate isomerase/epimerase family protein [Kribbella sp. CA-293567]|uniref:sugar phosphate isomerase/epimerase family protein n=1 Tax=Kribbella sp. CA-293567 TaxID=3002436 RepID=UPI0022DDC9E5|nr:sugar phosphate isomerase/epimerase family protein [Kribbella sp. CA-293567]WBQ01984.1 sugar phosphate isomerase/epimerase [Kribbella sp. CA-293567]
MKFAVFTGSTPDWTPAEAVKTLASQGWHGVEWRITDPVEAARPTFSAGNRATWPLTGLESRLDEISALTLDTGLEMPALGASVTPRQREDAERMLSAAAVLGVGQVRFRGVHVEKGQSYREAFAAYRGDWEWLEDRARRYGVRALLELHHESLTPSASAARRLVEGLDPRHVGVLHDLGNTVIAGWEEPAHALDLLGEYLAHVHLKNVAFHLAGVENDGTLRWAPKWVPLREGRAHLPEFFKALAGAGYTGWVTVEDFSTAQPLTERTRANLEYLSGLARAAGYDLG